MTNLMVKDMGKFSLSIYDEFIIEHFLGEIFGEITGRRARYRDKAEEWCKLQHLNQKGSGLIRSHNQQ